MSRRKAAPGKDRGPLSMKRPVGRDAGYNARLDETLRRVEMRGNLRIQHHPAGQQKPEHAPGMWTCWPEMDRPIEVP